MVRWLLCFDLGFQCFFNRFSPVQCPSFLLALASSANPHASVFCFTWTDWKFTSGTFVDVKKGTDGAVWVNRCLYFQICLFGCFFKSCPHPLYWWWGHVGSNIRSRPKAPLQHLLQCSCAIHYNNGREKHKTKNHFDTNAFICKLPPLLDSHILQVYPSQRWFSAMAAAGCPGQPPNGAWPRRVKCAAGRSVTRPGLEKLADILGIFWMIMIIMVLSLFFADYYHACLGWWCQQIFCGVRPPTRDGFLDLKHETMDISQAINQQPSRYNPIKWVIAWELTGPMWVVRSMLLQRTCCFWLKVVFFGVTNGVEETNCVLLSETIATLDDMFCSMETSNYVDHLFSCCTLVIYKKISALVADSWWGADLTRCKHLHAKCSEVIPLGFQRYLSCVSTLTCLLTLRGYDLLCSSACSTQ